MSHCSFLTTGDPMRCQGKWQVFLNVADREGNGRGTDITPLQLTPGTVSVSPPESGILRGGGGILGA